jgi:hypothetical protein
MEQKLAAITKPNGIDARAIVEWVAENLGLTAVHPTSSKDGWPDPEGTQSKEEKSRAGLAALRQRFGDLSSASERRASEAGILNYCMLHGPCDNYCMRDVKNRAGEVISQRCRMRAELKEEYCCRCTRCMPAEGQWRCEACDDECDGENCKDSACCTSVWMLPGTFRFELRVCRRHARLQVHIESLTHAIRANYDVQFVLDPVAVIEYVSCECTSVQIPRSMPCPLQSTAALQTAVPHEWLIFAFHRLSSTRPSQRSAARRSRI